MVIDAAITSHPRVGETAQAVIDRLGKTRRRRRSVHLAATSEAPRT